MTRWNHQRWGQPEDPIHQSDLNSLAGKFGCLEAFKRKKTDAALGTKKEYLTANGKLCAGNAAHSVLARILRNPASRDAALHLSAGDSFSHSQITAAFQQEMQIEADGKQIEWFKENGDKWCDDICVMIGEALSDLSFHVAEVVAVEQAFVTHVDGYWLTGTCDLIYRDANGALCLADWKTGKQVPHPIELDHGWQGAIYAHALRFGYFYESNDRAQGEADAIEIATAWQRSIDAGEGLDAATTWQLERVGAACYSEYPERVRYVQLRDYLPRKRASKKAVKRTEELAWLQMAEPGDHKYVAGDRTGPAWYHMNLREDFTPRLRYLLSSSVSWVRFGRMPPTPGEKCTRCVYREPCLLDGYKPFGKEKRQLDLIAKAAGLDGLDGFED